MYRCGKCKAQMPTGTEAPHSLQPERAHPCAPACALLSVSPAAYLLADELSLRCDNDHLTRLHVPHTLKRNGTKGTVL